MYKRDFKMNLRNKFNSYCLLLYYNYITATYNDIFNNLDILHTKLLTILVRFFYCKLVQKLRHHLYQSYILNTEYNDLVLASYQNENQ